MKLTIDWTRAKDDLISTQTPFNEGKTTINFRDACQDRSDVDYFNHLFPNKWLNNHVVVATNKKLILVRLRPTDLGELQIFIGILLLMTCFDFGPKRAWWTTTSKALDIMKIQRPNITEMCGISRKRFEDLMSNLTLSVFSEEERLADPWISVRPMVHSFNEMRRINVTAGGELCQDESTSRWRGEDGSFTSTGCPHITKIPRKPETLSMEIKDCADGLTKIILHIELMEKAEKMNQLEYVTEWGAAPAYCLRLAKRFHGSSRVVNGDSAFASVKTCLALHQKGLFFRGCVKTAHAGYPKAKIEELLKDKPSGSHVAFTAKVNGVNLVAVGWKDCTIKCFVGSVGTTLPGEPHVKHFTRWIGPGESEKFKSFVAQPEMINSYFTAANVIDVHNHLRQAGTGLETTHTTSFWQFRLFCTLLGMCETDAFLAKQYVTGDSSESHASFVENLAYTLMKPTWLEGRVLRSNDGGMDADNSDEGGHILAQIKDSKAYGSSSSSRSRKRKECVQLKCDLCSSTTTMYCKTCSIDNSDRKKARLVTVHGSGRLPCYRNHLLSFKGNDSIIE
jgi:hypothetical protein